MAAVYKSALDVMLTDGLDLESATVTAYLVSAGYTPNFDTDTTLTDVPAGSREASATVAGKQVQAGVFTASPTTFENATGSPVKAIVLTSGSQLVAYVDDFGAGPGQTELALNGSDITANWASSGIIALG